MSLPHVTVVRLVVVAAACVAACAKPCKIGAPYAAKEPSIQKIALYPLVVSDQAQADLDTQQFLPVFRETFYAKVRETRLLRAVDFAPPDEVERVLTDKGVHAATTGIVGLSVPIFRAPTAPELKVLKDEGLDGVLLFQVVGYNEVGAGSQMAQACLAGMVGAGAQAENNFVNVHMSFVDAASGEALWNFSGIVPGPAFEKKETVRTKLSEEAAKSFARFCPLSKDYKKGRCEGSL